MESLVAMRKLATALVGSLLALLVFGGVVIAPSAAPAARAADLIGPYPHPQFPNIDVYMDSKGVFFARNGASGFDVLPRTGSAALNKAQSVPSSYYSRLTQAAKTGAGGSLNSVAKVLQAAGRSTYSPMAVLANAGNLAGSAAGIVDKAKSTAPKVLATTGRTLVKGAGAIGGVLLAAEVGFVVGKEVSEAIGFDVQRGLCGGNPEGDLVSFLTGTDCSDLYQLAPDYLPNGDVAPGVSGGWACGPIPAGEFCVRLAGVVSVSGVRMYLFELQNPSSSGSRGVQYWVPSNLDTSGVNSPLTNPSGTSGSAAACRTAGGAGSVWCLTSGSQELIVKYAVNSFSPAADVVEVAGDPLRTLSCTITGSDGNSYSAQSPSFKETDGSLPAPECPSLPAGVHPMGISLGLDGGGQSHTLYQEETSPEFRQQQSLYPECADGSCLLDLRVDNASCFEGVSDCAEWLTDPQRDQKYSCYYGTHELPLSECFIYGQLFKPGVAVGPAPLADPQTGMPVGGPQTVPAEGPAMGDEVEDADQQRECWPSGWAMFNPVEWVLRPVQCALEWAFVPRAHVLTETAAQTQSAWAMFPTNQIATWFAGFQAQLSGDSSCGGVPVVFSTDWQMWPFNVPLRVEVNETILNACEEPVSFIAASGRLVQAFALAVGTVLVCARISGKSIGFTGFGKA